MAIRGAEIPGPKVVGTDGRDAVHRCASEKPDGIPAEPGRGHAEHEESDRWGDEENGKPRWKQQLIGAASFYSYSNRIECIRSRAERSRSRGRSAPNLRSRFRADDDRHWSGRKT